MRISKLIFFVTVFTLIVIACGVFFYVYESRKTIINNASYTIQHEAIEKAGQFNNSFRFAESSIKLVSLSLSDNQTPENLTSYNIFEDYADVSPFDQIHYIDEDGLNHLNSYEQLSPLSYKTSDVFIKGINGESGISADYKQPFSNQPVITFYAPYYYNGQVKGVLNGIINIEQYVLPLLKRNAYGHPVDYVLCDKELNVVAATSVDIPTGICFRRYADNAFVKDIVKHTEEKNSTSFKYVEDGKTGICCVCDIDSVDWTLIAIVLPSSLKNSLRAFTSKSYYLIAFVVFILLVYLCVRFYLHDKVIKQDEHEKYMETLIDHQSTQISMLSSFSGIYYSAHFIDLPSDTIAEINSAPELRKMQDPKLSVIEQIQNAMKLIASPEYVDEMTAFTNLDTVAKRLKDKRIISTEFLAVRYGWVRASFITVEKDEDNVPFKVLFVTQIIDDEKRREETLISSAYNDELTGLYNRRAYENDLNVFRNSVLSTDFVYISFDVNGLKNVNDTLGHEAGDELIRGAADCLNKCFGSYGKIYRTGGDEFQAIINVSKNVLDDLKVIFENTVDSWAGRLVAELRISAGYVVFADDVSLSISDITKLADQRMYKDKSKFYISRGVDRRGQQAAFEVLCQSYTKILKVDLEKDQYSILQMNEIEKDSLKGFSEQLSVWLHNFAMSGQVHPDDVEEYLRKTDIGYIKSYFNNGNKDFRFQYRRKINDEFRVVMMELCPAKEYSLENQTIYLYVKNIDKV